MFVCFWEPYMCLFDNMRCIVTAKISDENQTILLARPAKSCSKSKYVRPSSAIWFSRALQNTAPIVSVLKNMLSRELGRVISIKYGKFNDEFFVAKHAPAEPFWNCAVPGTIVHGHSSHSEAKSAANMTVLIVFRPGKTNFTARMIGFSVESVTKSWWNSEKYQIFWILAVFDGRFNGKSYYSGGKIGFAWTKRD